MTDIQRLKKLQVLANLIKVDLTPLERIGSLDGKIDDYLLFWPNRDQRAVICARTGKIMIYCCFENGVLKEHMGNGLLEFIGEIDGYIQEIEATIKYKLDNPEKPPNTSVEHFFG